MKEDQQKIEWRGDVPVSTRFDDPYFSLNDGLAETRFVFLEGNNLPARFRDGFHVAELGFGTGLNFLATLQYFRDAGVEGKLHFTSFEAFPMSAADRARALACFPDLPTETLLGEEDISHLSGSDFELSVIVGDARETVPEMRVRADAWFLDGFAPAQNPELWEDALLRNVARNTAPGGTFATYTAVGRVRRALADAGFEVERVKGFGVKRHMSKGRLP
ncbi:tRNA (5-methylaminomethyl-2-thiouridine)(34)-methyltransferase MnmD [Gymnodinialimonas ceratoperidinii]|uniref:tRNA (5-methylaminomethyl-2-thiouridine)(34)-methyltransferase MnmD n=1 Tax=Gymnodinialimonas ceratoperidinii TaxID=2856823 RepID=A0A8F6YAX8_9RHOB|nr:tRNA (5-methylaminomethyl-2-thiouridine)(34)-methyltransferase MnmD [Gymnodinialimonas ceratoperidinii]QXT39983.1 tRNA (5-methylaminomethyl-2-thiouridine)(34)-methyltransferase MnmD [Gymnodinialimonas ceratoperidinii]